MRIGRDRDTGEYFAISHGEDCLLSACCDSLTVLKISRADGCRVFCMNRHCLTKTLDWFGLPLESALLLFPPGDLPKATQSFLVNTGVSKKLTEQVWLGSHKRAAFRDLIDKEEARQAVEERQKTLRHIEIPEDEMEPAGTILPAENMCGILRMTESKVLTGNNMGTDVGVIIEKRQRMPLIKARELSLVIK